MKLEAFFQFHQILLCVCIVRPSWNRLTYCVCVPLLPRLADISQTSFFFLILLSLATKPTIWIFLSATHNSLPLYPLPSAQSYNNTMLPDAIFYLSYVPYTASHSAVPFTAIFRIFNALFTSLTCIMLVIAHVPSVPYISTACIGLKLTYLFIQLECEAFERRKSHASVTAIAKFFPTCWASP